MMTRLGKILVLLTTALSWSLAVWVYGAYTQSIDWGWKEPRKDIEKKRVPSELDTRKQHYAEAGASAERLLAGLLQARKQLHAARIQYPQNHLWYNLYLKTLASGQGKTEVKEILHDPATKKMVLNPAVIGMPAFGKAIPGLTLSEQKLKEELDDQLRQMEVLAKSMKKLDQEQKTITERLSPKKEAGKVVRKGLDDLAEVEAQTQFKLREEIRRLRPSWARELAEAQLVLERRESLRRRLDELRQKSKADEAP